MSEPIATTGKVRAKKIKPEPHPFERVIGELVSYYDEGWRVGYLEKVEAKVVHIRPITGINRTAARCTHVPIGNVKLIERK